MSIISTSELAFTEFETVELPAPFDKFLGRIERKATVFIWGSKGSGKSTFSLDFARALVDALGNGIYCSPEEGVSYTFKQRMERLEAEHPGLFVADYVSLNELKKQLREFDAKWTVLDSTQMSHASSKSIIEFHKWCKAENIVLVLVNHANKDGDYKGNSYLAHMVDIEICVESGTVRTEKNRYAPQGEMPVRFEVKRKSDKNTGKKKGRKNPPAKDETITKPIAAPRKNKQPKTDSLDKDLEELKILLTKKS